MKSKIHRAAITDANLDYEGSISIDRDLMDRAKMLPYEKVQVVNLNNGARFETYVIEAKAGSGEICLNGPAARLGHKGDLVIIISYCHLHREECEDFKPLIVKVNDKNHPL
jgi:aspartate 1-decarboxylase